MQTQDALKEFCEIVRRIYSDDFWLLFSAVYQERNVVIDRVLHTVKDVYVTSGKRKFASCVRQLRATTLKTAGNFCAHVLHEITIDLSEFNLPGKQSVKFTFVNPLWAWTQAANDMISNGHTLHFAAKAMFHEVTGERLYGAGVVFGDAIMYAASRTPTNAKPALFGISFDGGDSGVADRSVCPICVSVLNCDGADPLQCGLVGFMPNIDVPKSFTNNPAYLDARAYVVQECIGAILDEIENVQESGFTARIQRLGMVTFHPFLLAVRVDSKERKKYFGLKSDRSCSYMISYMCNTYDCPYTCNTYDCPYTCHTYDCPYTCHTYDRSYTALIYDRSYMGTHT